MSFSHENLPTRPVSYGIVGLGAMGMGIAHNLRRKIPADCKLYVLDTNKTAVQSFIDTTLGVVESVETPKSIAASCDVIITCLPPWVCDEVYTDPITGFIAASSCGPKSSKLFIETSSILISTSVLTGEKIEDSGLGYVIDCALTGGIPAAQNGTLTLLVGASDDQFQQALPTLQAIAHGERIFHLGGRGSGLAAKHINNYVAAVAYAALCEGMNAGIRYGLDAKVLTDALNAGSAMSWNSLYMVPIKGVQASSPASHDWQTGPSFDLALESIELVRDLFKRSNAKIMLVDVLEHLYLRASKSPLCVGREYRSIFRLFEEDASSLGRVKIEE